MSKVAVIMAGGTGGHIFPGLALADKLIEHGWKVEWIGTADRMEADIVPKHGIAINYIEVKGVRGNGLKRLLSAPFMLINAWWQARNILKKLQPKIVFGFGGYASGPGGLAAWSLRLPLVIHEQNAYAGMTNRYLAKVADKVLLGFPKAAEQFTQNSTEIVGNPVRMDIANLNATPARPLVSGDKVNILVIGGSLGARALNQMLPTIFCQQIAQGKLIEVWHQVGKGNQETVELDYAKQLQTNNELIKINEFIDDMPSALKWSDLVICRAGALTVSELAAAGRVGIFVPLPIAVDDHQTQNAKWLEDNNAGLIVQQKELKNKLPEVLSDLITHPEKINLMQENARRQAILTSTERMYEICSELEMKQ
jgi:UDP-N-acetylglucosamine--N-acetylmuramyl-(pentapeptide) pyrophosphoryl-undecaprenol N-acetylglucosamine transferase